MSATNRDAVRKCNDFYATPPWLTLMITHLRKYHPRRVLEPAVGDGAIARILKREFPDANISVGRHPHRSGFSQARIRRAIRFDHNQPALLAGNGVYLAALPLRAESGAVVMLSRVSLLEGLDRAEWMRAHTPSIYVTPRRPIFVGKKGDNCAYAWFVWDDNPPTVVILPTEKSRS
jgi:hypothetical protein